MAAKHSFAQDMPPDGGYERLEFIRIKAKRFWTGPKLWTISTAASLYWYYYYRITKREIQQRQIEERSANLALQPMLRAEQEREYLRQLRKNRDAERELMKNVEGWEVGKLFGEPIYKTIDPDHFVRGHLTEYYVHAAPKHEAEYSYFRNEHC